MRVLFSSDWHLGYEMGGANRVDRLPDQLRQLQLIAQYLEEHEVDVLAVSGDVFEAQERGRARAAVEAMMETLRPALERGLSLVMIAGNHDRDYFMDTASIWLSAQTPAGGRRVILSTRPQVVTLEARNERVNFVLLPFPTPSRYQITDLDSSGGAGSRNELIAKRFIEVMGNLRGQAAAQRIPAILLAHVTVEGAEVGPHRIGPRDDIVVPRSAFPSFEMTVIGHIHKPERLGSAHFYYVGGLDRMDIGETAYQNRVLVADIGPTGVREIQSLDLDPTPFEELVAESEDNLRRGRDSMARPDASLVKLRLRVPYGTYTAPLISIARQLFPRLYGNIDHDWVGAPTVAPSVTGLDPKDVASTVRRYLEDQVADEGERAELIELVEELRATLSSP